MDCLINAVKMNILPKFWFLSQTIPILIRKTIFASIDKTICNVKCTHMSIYKATTIRLFQFNLIVGHIWKFAMCPL